MVNKLRVALAQMRVSIDKHDNYMKAERMVALAAKKNAEIICLPELFTTIYFPQYEMFSEDCRESVHGETAELLSELAKKYGIAIVGGSIYERYRSKGFNTSLVFDADGTLVGKYRKVHIPHDPCFYEKNYFYEGDLGYRVFSTSAGKIGVLICYDQWFPEPARALALGGADVVFYPTALGTFDGTHNQKKEWIDAWKTMMRSHAIANGVCVVAVNRVGIEDAIRFFGHSFVCDGFGKVIEDCGETEKLLTAEVDLDYGKRVREEWGFLKNRVPWSYSTLTDQAVKK